MYTHILQARHVENIKVHQFRKTKALQEVVSCLGPETYTSCILFNVKRSRALARTEELRRRGAGNSSHVLPYVYSNDDKISNSNSNNNNNNNSNNNDNNNDKNMLYLLCCYIYVCLCLE